VIEHLEVLPYQLPMPRPWHSARGTLRGRTGWLVCAHCDGLRGYGDCAPLPAAGTENHSTAEAALRVWHNHAARQPLEAVLERIATDRSPAPAARYAVECALVDVASQRAGVPLRRWVSPSPTDSVAVNAALGRLSDLTVERLQDSLRLGFRVLKVKLGLESPDLDLRRLRDLAHRLPAGVSFRLDANGAWSLREASRMVDDLNALPIESLEEPLREPRGADLRRLQAAATFPLALDETCHRPGAVIALEDLPVRRVVLKPAAVGSLRRTLALAARMVARNVEVVVTSVLETAAGIWPTVQVAAATTSALAHGVASSSWLAADLGEPPAVVEGRIALPERPGSGFTPARRHHDEPLAAKRPTAGPAG
jgi:o-succinylbenzoate synthase